MTTRKRTRAHHASPRQTLEALEPRMLSSTVPVGVNLDGLADYSPSYLFVDAMKTARGFGSPNAPWDMSAAVNANGWPTTDSGACIITVPTTSNSVQSRESIAGTYHFSATGKVTVSGVASSLTVTNLVYDPTTNKTTADVNVAKGATQLYLSFTGTDGGISDVHLIRPGYAANTTQVFTNEYLKAISSVQTLRFMDYSRTNGNTTVNWSDRAEVTDATQTTGKGGAWEYAIQLANTAHKDMWINIPVGATDDYVTQLASLLKSSLDPSLHVYVEYSNEVWNSSFSQYGTNYDLAQQEETANPSVLNYDGANNSYYYAWRRVGERIEQISQDFASVYGQSAITTTIRPILASQSAWTYILRNTLDFLDHTYGDPSKYLYGVAGAPYINIGSMSDSSSLTLTQVFTALQNSINANQASLLQYDAMAAEYGLKNLYYEGGVDLEGSTAFSTVKVAANYDSRIATVITNYLTNAYNNGVDQVMYYGLSGAFGTSGTWGLTEDLTNLTGYKFSAFTKFINSTRPAITVGTKLPTGSATTSVAGGAFTADMWENAGSGGTASGQWNGASYDYLVNATSSGRYTLTLNASEVNSGNTVTVLVDGQAVGTLSLKNTGSSSAYANTVALSLGASGLAAGLHTIQLQVNGGGYSLKTLTFANAGASAPTGLMATPTSSTQMNLSWDSLSGASTIAIERSANGNSGWTQIGTTTGTATSFSNTGLAAGQTYYYRIRTLTSGKYSPYSTIAVGTTMTAVPIVLSGVKSTASGVSLTWTDTSGESGYLVQRQASGGSWTTLSTLSANSTSYLDTTANGKTYSYRVVALNTSKQLAVSNLLKVANK